MIFDLLPAGLRGLIIAALVAAIMSSVDSTLNSASTLVTMDFVKKLRPAASNRSLVIVGRIVTLSFMTLAIVWAPQILKFPDIWTYLQSTLSYLSPPFVARFIVGVFWRRANRTAACLGLCVGHLAAAVFFALNLMGVLIVQTGPLTTEQVASGAPVLHFLYLAPILLFVSIAVMVGASLAGDRPKPESVRGLTWSAAFFREKTRALQSLPWYKNYRYQALGLIAIMAVVVGMFW